ncbi:MAG: alginate export family protein [Bacteroidota bacterium]|nr:alginate export family protein [Bacteroidota bacterium]
MRKLYAFAIRGLLFFLSFSGKTLGQTAVDAEFRPRSEFRQGFDQPLPDGIKPALFTLQRTRLNFNYKGSVLNARLVLQDARVFGETDTKGTGTGTLGIYEAWTELLLFSGTSFKIGRQGVLFEDGRLFSLSPWSNTGNAHDLAQFRYFAQGFDIQLAYAYNNQKVYNADTSYYSVSKMYKQLAFLHLTKTLARGLDLSLLGVDEGFMKSKTDQELYHRYTTGGTLQQKNEKLLLGFLLTGYYQFGKSTPTVDLDAYLLALKVNYTFTDKIGGLVGADYYSGSGSTLAATKTNTFNKLPYGVNHIFNGFMEYWATLPKGGLINYFGGVNLKLSKKLSSEITYFGFRLAENMKLGTNDISKNLGSELDVVLNYKFSDETAVQFAWCGYFVTDGTKMLKYKSTIVETKFPQYAYLMLTIKPQLYKNPILAESK